MLKNLSCMNVLGDVHPDDTVTIVSGLPRSGTSMMMRMLAAGGLQPLMDGVRASDADNPHGYFEYEPVKEATSYAAWMNQAAGRAVKLVSRFIPRLPATHRYRILFMHRAIGDVLRSQRKMALHYSGADWRGQTVVELEATYRDHVRQCLRWAAQRPNIELLEVNYEQVLAEPDVQLHRIAGFLAPRLLDLDAMNGAIDRKLNHGQTAEEGLHA